MDFYQVKFMDLPDDMIHNHISKYLLEDKQINKIFYDKDDYYLLPKWADPEKLTLMQAVKIINFRMKNKNSDNINVKYLMEESNNIDSLIQEIKEK